MGEEILICEDDNMSVYVIKQGIGIGFVMLNVAELAYKSEDPAKGIIETVSDITEVIYDINNDIFIHKFEKLRHWQYISLSKIKKEMPSDLLYTTLDGNWYITWNGEGILNTINNSQDNKALINAFSYLTTNKDKLLPLIMEVYSEELLK